MLTKDMEDTCPAGVQMEGNDEGSMCVPFALDQVTTIDEQLISYACLENSDQSKFGSVLKGLKSQKSLENDQFLRTTTKAHGVLSSLDDQKRDNGHKPKGKDRDKKSKSNNINASKLSFTRQIETRHWVCGKPSHENPTVD